VRWVREWALRLRPEEFLALVFFVPSSAVTLKAYLFYVQAGAEVPGRIQNGVLRLAVTALAVILFALFVHAKPWWSRTSWIRDVMPFMFCIAIYTNLHDTIHFVNPHDVHGALIRIDQALFGVQPCVWAQRFYSPLLTDFFSIGYMNYFLISVAVVTYLLVVGRREEMRVALFGTIMCFYLGYFLYIAFPAAPPRLTLASQFVRDFSGGWITNAQQRLIDINPSSARGAFPSLHCAVTLITLIYAYRFKKALFLVLLPMGITLVLATVYLRHHYVIDILAGFALAPVAYRVAPSFERWWREQQQRHASADAALGEPQLGPVVAASALDEGRRR
jgi:membrane-associated phospholipid phosphatase